VARRSSDLLADIEAGAHDPTADLAGLLRKCITLGGKAGSERLRDWAALELKGYGSDDELPEYRQAVAPLTIDGATVAGRITGQLLPVTMIPDFARDKVTADISFPQPIAEIAHLLSSAMRGDGLVRMSPPGAQETRSPDQSSALRQLSDDRTPIPSGRRSTPVTDSRRCSDDLGRTRRRDATWS
jgi:hypothetical protein